MPENEENVLQYLLEFDRPDWESLKSHPAFSEKWVTFFLKRTRAIPAEAIKDIFRNRQLRKSYPVTLGLVRCKSTPLAISLGLLKVLRRYDLFMTLKQPYLPSSLRVRIEESFMESFPRLPLGERIALARQAPKGLVRHLRLLPDRPVIRALMTNYFFTYDDAMFLANHPRVQPDCLEELAQTAKWVSHREVRHSLLRNPKTPAHIVRKLIRSLSEFELKRSLEDVRIAPFTKKAIQRFLAAGRGSAPSHKP